MKLLGTILERKSPIARGVALVALGWGGLAAACTFEPGDRCGPNQEVWGDNVRCVCGEGYAWTADQGCVACRENEVPAPSGGCTCAPGTIRGAEGACEQAPGGLGVDCTESGLCSSQPYSHCEASAFGSYCTSKGCSSSAQCPTGYACDVASQVCRRPPVGLGQACQTDAECAGTEATYCDFFISRTCLVQGCTLSPDNCFEGFECCDLTMYGVAQPLCIPAGTCTT